MKKITSFLLLFLALWIANNSNLKAQAVVNTSVFWTTGWCTICNNINSGQYACAQGSGSPMWNNGQRTFTDPVPAGNQVTQVCATVNYVCCGLTSMTVVLNGVTVGTFNVPTGCNCSCGNCYTGTVCITNPPVYNYGGNNTIQVVNNGGNTCVNSVQLAITYQQACNNAITNNNISSSQTLCSNNLAAMLSGSLPGGGNGTYAYQWLSSTNNSTWSNVTNATSQNYTPPTPTSTVYFRRRVFSQPGCIDTSAFIGLYIQNPIGTNTIGANQTICNAGVPAQFTGTTPTGGNGNFQYSWESSSNAITWNPITGSNTLNYQSGAITSTTYFRRIITAGVCAASTSNSIEISLYPSISNNTVGNNQSICSGSQPSNMTGTIPIGGSGNYTYLWQSSPDNLNWTNVTGGATPNYQPPVLTVNMYFRRVVQSLPCADTSAVVTIRVDQPIGNNLIISDQTICAGVIPAQLSGSVATGGAGAPNYTWESSNNAITWAPAGGSGQNFTPPIPGGTIYYRRIISDGTCPSSTSNTVTLVVDQNISNNLIGTDQTICEGSIPNALTGIVPNGGNGAFTYMWESSPDNNIWIPIGSSNTVGYAPGAQMLTSYFRRVVNSGTCIPNTTSSVVIVVEGAINNNIITANQTICNGNTPAQFNGTTPTGGSGNYAYSWESSSDNLNWVVIPTGNTVNFTDGALIANTYYRRLVSSGVCAPSTSAEVNVLVNPVPTVAVNNAAVCFGQTTILSGAGSIPGGSYSWSTGENTQNISVTPTVTSTYTVTYTLNNCASAPADGVVTVNVPAVPNVLASGPLDLCPNGSVNLTSDPGVQYEWSHDNTLNVQTVSISNTGSYTVTVTDVNGCIATSLPIVVTVHSDPVVSATGTDVRCFGGNDGMGFASAVSGTLPYNYSWNTLPPQLNQMANGLTAGTYIVTVTDQYGCRDNATIIITQPAQLIVLPLMNETVSCYGGTDGSATALGNGGVAPYTFVWNTSPAQSTQIATGLAAGQVSVVLTDGFGCSTNASVNIIEPNELTITPNIIPVRCFGESTGGITAIVNGGTPQYFYDWNTNPPQNTPTASNLRKGNYQVTVTDGNGCSGSASFFLPEPDTLIVRATSTDAICTHTKTGTGTAIVSGGNGSYDYRWNSVPPQGTQTATNLEAGIYVITVNDPKGCVDTARAYVGQPQPVPFPVAIHDSVCPGENAIMSAWAPGDLKINWYRIPSDENPFFSGPQVNIPELNKTIFYQIESEDSKGCKSPRFPIFAWVYNLPLVDFVGSPLKAELPEAVVNFEPARSMDRPSIYSWSWNFGDGGQVSSFMAPSYQYGNEGTYDVTLTVVDTNGCVNKITKKALVEVSKMVSVFVPNAFSPNGDGVNDYFSLEYRLINEFAIVIYDRWGNQVYNSTDLKFRWDGTTNGIPNPDGTYVYVINGKASDGSAVQVGGNVILIR